jgi:N-acetyl-alpha-D-glucosaminyl L-malate synthase BshA
MRTFARIAEQVPSKLLLVGDGPELSTAYRLGRELGVSSRTHVLGAQELVIPLLSAADLFLLPSAQESFGLAALEAMACEVPVVASNVGGLPEVIEHGVSGFLHPPEDAEAMVESGVSLLRDPGLHERVTQAAVTRVRREFCAERVVPMYEHAYERVLAGLSP